MERNGYILGQGDAATVIGQFAATGGLSALGLVADTNFTFDVVDLSIALPNATAEDRESVWAELPETERGSMTAKQLATAIRLTEGHKGNVLPETVTAQDAVSYTHLTLPTICSV